MALHRVRLDLAFADPSDALSLFRLARSMFPVAARVHAEPGSLYTGYVQLHECHHDDPGGGPCVVIAHDQLKGT